LSILTRPGALERALERLLMPAVLPESKRRRGRHSPVNDDFTRVVGVVAAAAVGFFPASLLIANVPPDRWLIYLVAASMAGIVVAGSFMFIGRGARVASLGAVVNVFSIAVIGAMFGAHYHQLGLLFALIVAAHAVVHGLYPALLAALLGAVAVPYAIQIGVPINPTDPVYAFIYLAGAALVPWTAGKLAQRRATAIAAQLEVTEATEREAVMILARAAEAKDHSTGDHVVRVGDLAMRLASSAGMSHSEAEDLRFAAMLHDVGKLHLPDSVLQKPGPLTADEWQVVKRHTIWGERILGATAGFELARKVARSHHENFDGSGYPDGLRGEAIPFAARIVRVADVFDALSHSRPYKDAWDISRVVDEIRSGAGTSYDPDLARELIAMFERHLLAETPGVVGALERRVLTAGLKLPTAT
jgi:hypothetical protein